MLLFGLVLLYFACLESALGQTFGKKLWRIKVMRTDGGPPSPYSVFLRTCIFFFPSLIGGVVYDLLLQAVYVPPRLSNILTFTLQSTVLIIWPISAIFGRGQVALHDHLTRCCVVRTSRVAIKPPGANYLLRSVLVTLIVSTLAAGLLSKVEDRYLPAAVGLANNEPDLLPEPLWYDRHIAGASEYITSIHGVTIGSGHAPTFSNSFIAAIPDALKDGKYTYAGVIRYDIGVKPKALLSTQFPDYLSRLLVARAHEKYGAEYPNGLLVDCNLRAEARVGFFSVVISRRLVGGWVMAKGARLTFVLEPDEGSLSYGVQIATTWRDPARTLGAEI